MLALPSVRAWLTNGGTALVALAGWVARRNCRRWRWRLRRTLTLFTEPSALRPADGCLQLEAIVIPLPLSLIDVRLIG